MKNTTKESAGGFSIPPVGSGRNLIQPSVGNEVIAKLNTLGKISIVRSAGDRDEVYYSDANVVLSLGASAGENVAGSVTVSEVDGTPSVTNVTQIKFPAGTVTNDGGGVVSIAVGTITVEESDGTPSVASVSKIKFSGATVTDDGSGIVTVAASGLLQMYRLKSVQGDYITCRTWDGTTEGGSDVYLAKPMKLRNSITAATISGASVTYSYTNTVTRVATISSTDETQVVVPRYLTDDLVFGMTCNATGVSGKNILDINADGRAWAKQA